MFIIKINNTDYAIDSLISSRVICSIYKTCPFVFNTKRHFFWDYIKLQNTHEGVEVTFLKYLNLQDRCFAFLLLSTLLSKYDIYVVGAGIRVEVHPELKYKLGEEFTEKILFPHPVSIWNLSPDKQMLSIDIPYEKCQKLLWAQNLEFVSAISDYFSLKIPPENVKSLILA